MSAAARPLIVLPWVVPAFVTILIWKGLFNYHFGAVNGLLGALGIVKIPWLIDPVAARISVLIVSVWLAIPFMTVSASSIIESLPTGIFDAARLDGAGPFRSFFYLTLPLVTRRMIPVLVLGFTASFNNFTAIYLLTSGGPAYPGAIGGAGATDIIISYIFKLTLMSRRYGLAAAYAVVVFAAIGAYHDCRHAPVSVRSGRRPSDAVGTDLRSGGKGRRTGLFVSVLALISAAPILFIVSVSFSSGGRALCRKYPPDRVDPRQLPDPLSGDGFSPWVGNSMIVASSTALIAVVITSLAAWTLSRYRFLGRSAIASGLFLVQLFPGGDVARGDLQDSPVSQDTGYPRRAGPRLPGRGRSLCDLDSQRIL